MNSNTNCISYSKYDILLKCMYDISLWAILIHNQYYCVPWKNILYTSHISARILCMSESSPGCLGAQPTCITFWRNHPAQAVFLEQLCSLETC